MCMASSLPEAPTACRCGCQQGSHWHPLSEIKVGVGRWFYLCARICFKSRPVQPVSTQVTQKQLQLHFLFLTHNSSEGEYLGQQNKTFRCYTDTVTVNPPHALPPRSTCFTARWSPHTWPVPPVSLPASPSAPNRELGILGRMGTARLRLRGGRHHAHSTLVPIDVKSTSHSQNDRKVT